MTKYTVTMTERGGIMAAGYMVRTDMRNAATDCPALWNAKFGPQMAAFPADPSHLNESYGISTNTDFKTGAFDYWAAMPLAPGATTPPGMKTIEIPAGIYGVCALPGLEDIGPAYEFLEKEWLPSQKEYDFDTANGMFYELYGPDYLTEGKLAIYCKLAPRENL